MSTPFGKIPKVILSSCGPTVAASEITKMRSGNAIVTSVNREMIVSTQPRKYPAVAPRRTPMTITPSVERPATSSEILAP